MDFSRIKKMVQQGGDKFIVIENGEPELVILSFEEYERLIGHSEITRPNVRKEAEKLPWEDEYLYKEPYENPRESSLSPMVMGESIGLPVRLEDIRVEDLPI